VRELQRLGAEVAVTDFTKPETLDKALEGVDRLVIIPPFSEHLLEISNAWANAAKRNNIQFVVKLGGLVSAERASAIAEWHDDAEKHIAQIGIPHSFVRASFLMSNITNQINSIKVSILLFSMQ
jgi:NAD(P)H dehydrogenase (quinone)